MTLPLLLVLLPILACKGDKDPGETGQEDGDGDGVPLGLDCDDQDPDVGAPVPRYADADGDTFGDPATVEESCDAVSGHVDNALDCDDTDPAEPVVVDGSAGDDGAAGTGDAPLATVAAGVARATGCVAVRPGTYTGTVVLDHDLQVGATGTAEVTVLDGAGSGPVVDVEGATVVLAGFTLTGGTGWSDPGGRLGGALWAFSSPSVTLESCVLEGNTADYGGAVFTPETGLFVARDTVFRGNTATKSGGALYAFTGIQLQDVTLEDNGAEFGGALYLGGGATVTSAVVGRGNTAGKRGGAVYLDGASTLEGGTWEGNSATDYGGAIYVKSGGALRSASLVGNTADQGAGLAAEGSLEIQDLTVQDNVATYGGGVWASDTLTWTGGTVSGNQAQMGAGLLLSAARATFTEVTVTANVGSVNGGGLYVQDSDLALTSFTVSSNQAPYGAGLDLDGAQVTASDDTTVSQNVAAEYGGGAYIYASSAWSGGRFDANQSLHGAGIHVTAPLTLSGVTLSANVATGNGGGIFCGAQVDAQATTLDGNRSTGSGAGIFVESGTSTFQSSTVVSNVASAPGGGARVYGGTLVSTGSDWGTGGTDNAPDDVSAGSQVLSDKGADASFTCDTGGCR